MNKLQCLICFQQFNSTNRLPQVLPCVHTFCAECLSNWTSRGTCPSCRIAFVVTDIKTNQVVLDLINNPPPASSNRTATRTPLSSTQATGSARSGLIQMTLTMMNGPPMAIRVDTTKDVAYLKNMIAQLSGTRADQLVLFYEGRAIVEGDPLAVYGFEANHVINLLGKNKGGR